MSVEHTLTVKWFKQEGSRRLIGWKQLKITSHTLSRMVIEKSQIEKYQIPDQRGSTRALIG